MSTVESSADNKKGTHFFEAESFVPNDARAARDHLKLIERDDYAGDRIVRVRKVVRKQQAPEE